MARGKPLGEHIAELVKAKGRSVAVAESLTGGLLTSRLATASEASSWLRGGLVAYSPEVKFRLLQVPEGPVVTETAASTMARSVAELLGADTGVAVTGVGGPGPEEGLPPGTVWIGLYLDGEVGTSLLRVDGESPEAICERTCNDALRLLAEGLSGK